MLGRQLQSEYQRFRVVSWLSRCAQQEAMMAKRSIAERLAQIDAQRKKLQSRLGKQERAKDTRRKVLLGAFVLYRLEKPDGSDVCKNLPAWLKHELPQFLTREDDLALFIDLAGSAGDKGSKAADGGAARQQGPRPTSGWHGRPSKACFAPPRAIRSGQ
jgi:hypothetical protein